MADRFLPADDPVLEEVLNWTVARDAQDIRRLLEWLPLARSSKERRALLARVHELLGEVELSFNGLDSMHRGVFQLTGIILAGGKSSRMGEDKSLLNSNVERLARELEASGCERVIIMCGSEERADLFPGECHIDTKETLAESLFELISNLHGTIQLAPCDAYLADESYSHESEVCPQTMRGIGSRY